MASITQNPEIREKIRSFLIDNFLLGDAAGMVADGDSLLGSGTMDSTGVMELVDFAEKTFGVRFQDSDMNMENLDSVAGLTEFIRVRRPHAA
jgi:acyl carrier protein